MGRLERKLDFDALKRAQRAARPHKVSRISIGGPIRPKPSEWPDPVHAQRLDVKRKSLGKVWRA